MQLLESRSGQLEGLQIATLLGQSVQSVELGDAFWSRFEHGVHQVTRHVEQTIGLKECKWFLRVSAKREIKGFNFRNSILQIYEANSGISSLSEPYRTASAARSWP